MKPPLKKTNKTVSLHPQEEELIMLLRSTYRFGTIEIVMRDGLPVDILKTVIRQRIGGEKP